MSEEVYTSILSKKKLPDSEKNGFVLRYLYTAYAIVLSRIQLVQTGFPELPASEIDIRQ